MQQSESLRKYDPLLEEKLVFLKQVYPLDSNNNWTLDVEKDNLTIHSKYHQETGLKIIRAQTVINAPADKIIAVSKEVTTSLEWDKTLENCDQLYYKDGYHVLHALVKKTPLVVQREVVILAKFYYENDGTIYNVATSIDFPGIEESIYKVRAQIHLIGWVLLPDPSDPNKTNYTFIMHVDPSGWVPKTLINWFSFTQGYNVRVFGDYVEGRFKKDAVKKEGEGDTCAEA